MSLTVEDGRTQDLVGSGQLRKLVANPIAYRIQYRDGLVAWLLNLRGAVQDFKFAARITGKGIKSTQFLLTPEPNVTYSACLMSQAEEMFETGRAPYPVERTLLTSGIPEACHTSGSLGQKDLATPQPAVEYLASKTSQYCRA